MRRSDSLPGYFTFRSVYRSLLEQIPHDGWFVEVGAFAGQSAAFMYEEMELSNRTDVHMCIVDHCEQYPEPLLRKNLGGLNIGKILGAKSWHAASVFPDASLDVVYLDAGHSYDDVKRDIEAWLPKVKCGGVLAGHDYGVDTQDLEGVTRAVDERFGEDIVVLAGEQWTDGNCYPSWIYTVKR